MWININRMLTSKLNYMRTLSRTKPLSQPKLRPAFIFVCLVSLLLPSCFFRVDLNEDMGFQDIEIGTPPQTTEAPLPGDEYVLEGDRAFKEGDYETAIDFYEQSLDFEANFGLRLGSLVNRGLALGEVGQPEAGLESLTLATEFAPQASVTWYNKGYALYTLGRHQEALEAYDKALELESNDTIRAARAEALAALDQQEDTTQ